MTMMKEKEMVEKKDSVINVLSLVFPKYRTLFTPRSIILQGDT
ncbi:MAG: hypothetical protein PUJ51_08555 [Clostridiales bacterium]|nr:hypothetical protein [Clostridiales bacterium]